MSNAEVYAGGLLNRALDRATQPPAIRDFLDVEFERLREIVGRSRRVVDFGCGTGRHLASLGPSLALGVGLDYERASIRAAARSDIQGPVHFIVADAGLVPLLPRFDAAICTTNTWGTMPDRLGVLREMRRVAPTPGSRVISVYARTSIEARREWYAQLGLTVTKETAECLVTAEGFRSEHFTIGRLRGLLGRCEIEPLGEIGLIALV
jgi:SAM-dependent methyltransferase